MTSTATRQAKRHPARQAKQVAEGSFAMVVVLIVQYVLGIAYNLYGTAPTATSALTMTANPLIAAHVVVGTLIVVGAIFQVVRAVRAGTPLGTALCAVGLLAVLGAWFSGSSFTRTGANGASMAMASLTAVALLCYSVNVRVLGARRAG